MLETLFGGVLGGLFRLAPEILKWLDRKGERQHELFMLQAEMEFAKVRGEIAMKQTEAVMTTAELNTMDPIGLGQTFGDLCFCRHLLRCQGRGLLYRFGPGGRLEAPIGLHVEPR